MNLFKASPIPKCGTSVNNRGISPCYLGGVCHDCRMNVEKRLGMGLLQREPSVGVEEEATKEELGAGAELGVVGVG